MSEYLVTWQISVEADSARAAAEEALRIQRTPGSLAVVFEVERDLGHGRLESVTVDLLDESAA